jgi:hypothetical protein
MGNYEDEDDAQEGCGTNLWKDRGQIAFFATKVLNYPRSEGRKR